MTRSLSLKRETLADLSSADLESVVAGVLPSGLTCPVLYCMSGSICTLTAQPACWAP